MSDRVQTAVRRYAVSALAVAVATGGRLALDPVIGSDVLPLLTMYLAVIVAAWYGGLGPGLFAVGLGALVGDRVLLASGHELLSPSPADRIDLIRFAVVGAALALFANWTHASRHELEAANRTLREQRERLRVTLGSIGDGVIVTEPAGRVAFMNRVAEELTGWTQAEAGGRDLDQVFHTIDQDTRTVVESPVAPRWTEGMVARRADDRVLVSRHGTERPIEETSAPIKDAKGRLLGSVQVFRDTSERKTAERERRWSEERFRLAVHATNDSVWDLDPATGAVWRNETYEALFGAKSGDLTSAWEWWSERIHPDDRERVVTGLERAMTGGDERWGEEYRFRRLDGSYAFVGDRAYIARDEIGRAVRVLGVMRDLTEQKRHQQSLEEADRRKTEFLATLAHELRNPLNPIKNAVQILRLRSESPEVLEWGQDMIDRQVGYLTRLIDDLLDVSRITRGKLDLRKSRIELAPVVREAVESSRPLIEQYRHRLTVSLPAEPIHLHADAIRVSQVFMNLLTNAAKYTPDGGRIWLGAKPEGQEVVVSVKDDGIGLAQDEVPRLFEMFFQADRSRERAQGGLGIGLTLVKQLVEMHGGRVGATSPGAGLGCEFVVRLPILDRAADPSAAPAAPESSSSGGRRILVVDDNRDSACSLAALLELMGNEVATAFDGQEAIQAAARFLPDVVLLDIGMPKLNGYDACRRLRQEPWGKRMVVIAQTGWGQAEDRRASRDAGFDGHLVKPIDHAALTNLLAELDAGRST